MKSTFIELSGKVSCHCARISVCVCVCVCVRGQKCVNQRGNWRCPTRHCFSAGCDDRAREGKLLGGNVRGEIGATRRFDI